MLASVSPIESICSSRHTRGFCHERFDPRDAARPPPNGTIRQLFTLLHERADGISLSWAPDRCRHLARKRLPADAAWLRQRYPDLLAGNARPGSWQTSTHAARSALPCGRCDADPHCGCCRPGDDLVEGLQRHVAIDRRARSARTGRPADRWPVAASTSARSSIRTLPAEHGLAFLLSRAARRPGDHEGDLVADPDRQRLGDLCGGDAVAGSGLGHGGGVVVSSITARSGALSAKNALTDSRLMQVSLK